MFKSFFQKYIIKDHKSLDTKSFILRGVFCICANLVSIAVTAMIIKDNILKNFVRLLNGVILMIIALH